MSEQVKKKVIVAPHFDDEIIGCFEVLESNDRCYIIYRNTSVEKIRKEEALKLKKYYDIEQYFHSKIIPPNLLSIENTFYYPNPTSENHPDHRLIGYEGEKLARSGYNVVFYTIQMNVPYIHKSKNPSKKESLLNEIYPSQKSLWEYEKKYVLFEGYCKWIF